MTAVKLRLYKGDASAPPTFAELGFLHIAAAVVPVRPGQVIPAVDIAEAVVRAVPEVADMAAIPRVTVF